MQRITITDHSDTFTAHGTTETHVLSDGHITRIGHHSELACLVSVLAQVFEDNANRLSDTHRAEVESIRNMFTAMSYLARTDKPVQARPVAA